MEGRHAPRRDQRTTAIGIWTADRLVRACGPILIAGGFAIAVAALAHPDDRHPPLPESMASGDYLFWHLVAAAGYTCLACGVVGPVAFQLQREGSVGLLDAIGLLLTIAGSVTQAGVQFADGLALRAIAAIVPKLFDINGALYGAPPMAGPTAVAGTLLAFGVSGIGIGALQRSGLPRRAVIALMAGGILAGLPVQPASPVPAWVVIAGAVLLGVGAAGIGGWLWRGGDPPSRLPPLPPQRPASA